ncbi:MAG: uroporphyrinogen decarboxylase [Candidatus Latescibacteria bacterium]|nr:uroporphyrinogen decarboxylase [Candidatus Latescibacterota bacterium]
MTGTASSSFLQACQGQVPARRPVWLMRQAGRILKPYRELREKTGSILKLFKTPELAAQVTLMPVAMLEVDAAILFADILTPVEPMGCQIDFVPGPVFAKPVQSRADIDALSTIDPQAQLPYVLETIRLVRRALPPGIPLIGFAGAPFTLATYMVEGGGAKEFTRFRRLLHADQGAAEALLDKLTEVTILYLKAQIAAGTQAVQLFDTWIGALSPALFAQLALPRLQRIFSALEGLGVPRIYYANGAAHFLDLLPGTGADVLGLDWRADLAQAFRLFGGRIPLQGNMDPCALFADPSAIAAEAERILRQTRGLPHVFNLGHGVHPDTPCDHVKLLVDTVHGYHPST